MGDVTVLDPTRSAQDVAHDQKRFERLGLTSANIVEKLAEAGSEVAGWGAGNEAAVIRFAMAEIVRSRADRVATDQIREIPLPPSTGINAWIDAEVANNVYGAMAGDEVVTVEVAAEIARGAALAVIADRETLIANLRRAGYVVSAPGEENFR